MPDQGTSATDVAAWVGAVGSVFGIIAFGWDIYKWRKRGPELHVALYSNMHMHRPGDRVAPNPPSLIIVDVVNRGAMPTTITNLVGEHYTSLWQRLLRRKPESALWIRPMLDGGQVPHVLNPGEVWKALLPQAQFHEMLTLGRVRIGVCHSADEAPVYRWLRVREDTPRAG